MEQYKLSFTTLSNVLISSGKSATLIDTDVEFHKSGFPFIRARTIKGLLKESVEEVCEMENIDEKDVILEYFFGKGGWNEVSAKLRFDNFYLKDWAKLKSQASHSGFTSPQIINQYTSIIQQTAIDENELAKDTSLRTYRVLKPNISFEGILEVKENNYSAILENAIINLRYAGVRRNRGFGRIRLEKDKIEIAVPNNRELKITNERKLSVKLTTKHPVVLGLQLGDQNTVNTQQFISGNQLRGLIIGEYIKKKNGKFDTAEFFDLFISGKIIFNPLYFNNSGPLPLHIHFKKNDPLKKRVPENVFTIDNEITKPYGGMALQNGNDFQNEMPATTLFFHNTRKDRTAGKSTNNEADAGGIFYYEALDEDQSFEGTIEGNTEILKKLAPYLSADFETIIGKSRSAQYGKVQIELSPLNENAATLAIQQGGKYIIKLETPLVLLNEFGFPECSEKTFLVALKPKFDADEVEYTAAAFTKIEQYNQVWESKSGKMDAYKEGSVFVVTAKNTRDIEKQFYLGQWNEQGFGKCSIEDYETQRKYNIIVKSNSDFNEASEATHSELVTLIETTNHQSDLQAVKMKALELVKDYEGKLKNHLIGRLIYAFENMKTAEDFTKFIASLQGKPAGDALKNKRLCTPDGEFRLNLIGTAEYEMQKEGWLFLLQILRKLNKKQDVKTKS